MVLFIEKGEPGEAPSLQEVSRGAAIQGLLRSLICFDKTPEVLAQNWARLEGLTAQVPTYRLRYYRDLGQEAVALLGQRLQAA